MKISALKNLIIDVHQLSDETIPVYFVQIKRFIRLAEQLTTIICESQA